jgi:hypothetical protein
MATKIMTDTTDALNASNLNRFVGIDQSGGIKKQCVMAFARIQYTGAAWQISGGADSAGIVSGDVSFSTDHTQVVLAEGYSASKFPLGFSCLVDAATYLPSCKANSETRMDIVWRNNSGTKQTSESTAMDAEILTLGTGTKILTDGSSALSEDILNKFIGVDQSDAAKRGVIMKYARINYTGSAWQVVSTYDSAGIVSGNLSWSTDHLIIDVTSGAFTKYPVVIATTTSDTTTAFYQVHAVCTSATSVSIYFTNYSSSVITTQATSMDFQIMIFSV